LDIYSAHDNLWQSKWISNTGTLISHWTDNNKGMKYSTKLNGNMPNEEFTSESSFLLYKKELVLF
jgi:hypothetical protein